MNILITGGSGFIGTRLVDELLKDNHKIIIFDKVKSSKYPYMTLIGDVRDEKALNKAFKNIDIVYNLAAEHADDVKPISLYRDVNVGGAENVIKAAEFNCVRTIIFTSSVAIYGLNRGTPDEIMKPQPFNEYGRTKNEAEKIFLNWAKETKGNSLTILRPAVVFGENNRGNVYNLINQISSGKFIMIGNGANKKSMSYVGNIASFLSTQTNAEPGIYTYNFADKPDLTSKEIVDIVRDELKFKKLTPTMPYFVGLIGGYIFDLLSVITGKKFQVSSIRIKKFAAETTVCTDELNKSGFKKPFLLEEGLRKMVMYEFKDK